MSQLNLFDTPPVVDETIKTEDDFENIISYKQIDIIPDDLTIIRILIEKEAYRDDRDSREAAENYVDKQMEGKFDIYNDNIKDIDALRDWACDKVADLFYAVQQVLLDVLYICAEEMQSISLNPNKDNADYIAYLYNLNAPYHQKDPLPYQDLINALRACK